MSFGSKVNSSDIDEARPLFAFVPPNMVPGFYFVNTNNQPSGSDPGAIVYLHFGNGLTVNIGDIRITPFSDMYPAGSQVKVGDTDLPYKLQPTSLVPKFFDVNGDGFYSLEDPVYLVDSGSDFVRSGALRLSKDNQGYSAGSFVRDGNDDNGHQLSSLPSDLRFSNNNGDVSTAEHYNVGDNVYLDTTPPFVPPTSFTVVSVNDIRISI